MLPGKAANHCVSSAFLHLAANALNVSTFSGVFLIVRDMSSSITDSIMIRMVYVVSDAEAAGERPGWLSGHRPGASYPAPLCLIFLTCKMGTITAAPHGAIMML